MKDGGPVVGEWWFIRIRDAQCLVKVLVTDLTPLTVGVQTEWPGLPMRYEHSDLTFVELAHPVEDAAREQPAAKEATP